MKSKEFDSIWNAAVNNTVKCVLETIDGIVYAYTAMLDGDQLDSDYVNACRNIAKAVKALEVRSE